VGHGDPSYRSTDAGARPADRRRHPHRRGAPTRGPDAIEAIFVFETSVGPCNAVVRLVSEGGARRLDADDRAGRDPRARGPGQRPALAGRGLEAHFGGENWLDRRNRARAYADRDPAVLVVGAAQAGLSVAARLTLLGVDTLVVDARRGSATAGAAATTR
jgi:putative flavoprotein involved in K+ transport